MVTLDGTNFWTTGQAGAGTVKYVNSTVSQIRQWQRYSQLIGGQRRRRARHPDCQRTRSRFSRANNLVLCGQPGRQRLVCDEQDARRSGNVVFTTLLSTGGGSRRILPSVRITRRFTSPSPGCGPARAPAPAALSGGIRTAAAAQLQLYPAGPAGGNSNQRGARLDGGLQREFHLGRGVVTGAKIYATSTGAAGNSLVQVVDNGNRNLLDSRQCWPPPARTRPCAACVSVRPP